MKKIVSILLTLSLVVGLYLPSVSAASLTTTQPVVHLTFDGDLKDSSGNGYNGSAPDAEVTYMDGVIGKAARVDSAMITLLGSSKIDFDKEFSLSCWLKLDADPVVSYSIISSFSEDEVDRFTISYGYGDTHIGTAGSFEYIEDPSDSRLFDNGQDTYITPEKDKDRFMHLAVVYNGISWKYYLDGKLDGTYNIDKEMTKGGFYGIGKDLIIGGTGADTFFHGYMDDMYIFDKAIPFTDVTALYKAGVKTASHSMVLTINDPYMMVNGTKKEIDPGRGTAPVVNAQNRTILPIRAVIEAMGGTIAWDGPTQCATLKLNSNTIKLWINKDKAEVNGVLKDIDADNPVVPEMINGRTMIPIRFVLKELGLPELVWDGTLRTITIQY